MLLSLLYFFLYFFSCCCSLRGFLHVTIRKMNWLWMSLPFFSAPANCLTLPEYLCSIRITINQTFSPHLKLIMCFETTRFGEMKPSPLSAQSKIRNTARQNIRNRGHCWFQVGLSISKHFWREVNNSWSLEPKITISYHHNVRVFLCGCLRLL